MNSILLATLLAVAAAAPKSYGPPPQFGGGGGGSRGGGSRGSYISGGRGAAGPGFGPGGFSGVSVGGGGGGSAGGRPAYSGGAGGFGGGPVVEILRDDRNGPIDGVYDFAFETADGVSRNEQGAPTGPNGAVVQHGAWTFTFPDGTKGQFSFIADEGGYRVLSPLLPTPPPLPQHAIEQIERAERERAQGIIHDGQYYPSQYGGSSDGGQGFRGSRGGRQGFRGSMGGGQGFRESSSGQASGYGRSQSSGFSGQSSFSRGQSSFGGGQSSGFGGSQGGFSQSGQRGGQRGGGYA